jgi:hypothetical protein
MFNTYEEHGPIDIRVATDQEGARRIFEELIKEYSDEAYIAECRNSLEQMLASADPTCGDLGRGWGGLQLHIVDTE